MKKSVVATTHVWSSSRHTAASSPVSVPTSRLAKGAAAGCSARRSRRTEGASLQPQPPPCASVVRRKKGSFMPQSLCFGGGRAGPPARDRTAGGGAAYWKDDLMSAAQVEPERRTFQRARLRAPTPRLRPEETPRHAGATTTTRA